MDVLNRIKIDMVNGGWRVLFGGRLIKQAFKTAEDAIQHLDKLKRKTAKPEYEE